MIGIYFSGTGNTCHCVERFVSAIDSDSKCYSIEDGEAINALKQQKTVVFGFPVYYSNLPKIVKDFIIENKDVYATIKKVQKNLSF